MENVEKIDLSDNEKEWKEIQTEKRNRMRSNPDHKKIQEYRQHKLAFGWRIMRRRQAGSGETSHGPRNIKNFEHLWKMPVYKNTVGQTKHPLPSQSE